MVMHGLRGDAEAVAVLDPCLAKSQWWRIDRRLRRWRVALQGDRQCRDLFNRLFVEVADMISQQLAHSLNFAVQLVG